MPVVSLFIIFSIDTHGRVGAMNGVDNLFLFLSLEAHPSSGLLVHGLASPFFCPLINPFPSTNSI